MFHPVERSAVFLQQAFEGAGGMNLASPLKLVVKPPSDFLTEALPYEVPLVVLALLVLFFALMQLMRFLRGAVMPKVEGLFDRVLFRNDAASFAVGIATTVGVQSSSATDSNGVSASARVTAERPR